MIEVIELGKSYSRRKILEKVSFSLTDSCIYALVGRNGTGKTTLLTSMVEASFKDFGIVKIDGMVVSRIFRTLVRSLCCK